MRRRASKPHGIRTPRPGRRDSTHRAQRSAPFQLPDGTYRSPFPDVVVHAQPLADFVFADAHRYSNKAAIIEGPTGRTFTYTQLLEAIRRAAAGLAQRGFGKGDVLAIYSPNLPEYAIAFYAAAMVGGVITTINPLYSVTELTHQLRDSRARFLITAPHLLNTAREAAARLEIAEVFTFGHARHAVPFEDLAGTRAVPSPRFDLTDDIVALPYSSGTTGLPKGVMLTHYTLVANIHQIKAVERTTCDEVLIATLPFYHIYGMVVVMMAGLHAGATIVTMPRFGVRTFLEVIERYRVTTAYLVPPLVRTLAKHSLVNRYDLSSLRDVVSGGAPLPESIARACAERNHCTVRQLYGLTECSPVTHVSPRNAPRMNSVGVALPSTKFRIVDVALGRDVPVGELGEVWIRGPQLMKGYLNNPEATSGMIDDKGWLHTGDIGYTDKDGYLYVLDRAKELIKFRGLQYGENELLLAMVEEIGARRQAASRVAFQALLLDSVRESVVATDLQHRVTFWNKGAKTLFGYEADAAIGRSLDELVVPHDPTVVAARREELKELERQGNWKGQAIRSRSDGSRLWIDLVASMITDADGRPSGFVAIHRDITEQKTVEQRLRFQAQLLDSVRESVVAIDLDGRIVFWGRGAESLFGYAVGEMVGQTVPSLILPVASDAPEEVRRICSHVFQEGTWRVQAARHSKSGPEFFADIAVAPVRDARGQPAGLIAIHRDITELRRKEETIRQSRERMRNLAANLMVIREQERSAISRELHDELGQALTGLSIELRGLIDRLPRNLKTRHTEAMMPLIDRTLETVRSICTQLRPAILDDLGLEAAIEWQAHEFAGRNGCRCKLDLRIGKLTPNRDRDTAAFRIVQEALTNVARHARAKRVTLRGRSTRHELALQIEDDGVGFDEGKLTSAHSLGLLGMRERAEAVGGRIAIRPRVGIGTLVDLRMPLEERSS